MPYKMNIEELLVEHGYLTRSQLERAMYFKEQEPGKTAEQILVDLGYVTEEAVMECAAVRDHLQVTDLDSYKIDLKAADMVSPAFAGHNRIIPLTWMSLTRPQPLPAWRSRWSLGHPRQWDGPLTGRMKIPQAVIMDS